MVSNGICIDPNLPRDYIANRRSISARGTFFSGMQVPMPWCVSNTPRISNSRYARTPVFGLIARSTPTCRTVGGLVADRQPAGRNPAQNLVVL
jgi:hypothetical protein